MQGVENLCLQCVRLALRNRRNVDGQRPGAHTHVTNNLGRLVASTATERSTLAFEVLYWFLGMPPIRVVGWGGRKFRTSTDLLDHLSLTFEFPRSIIVNF